MYLPQISKVNDARFRWNGAVTVVFLTVLACGNSIYNRGKFIYYHALLQKKMKVHSKVAAGKYVAKCAVYFCGIKTNVHTPLSGNTSPY